MGSKAVSTELKNLEFFETNFRSSFRRGNILGLGESYYSPGSGTATIKAYLSDRKERLPSGGPFVYPHLSPMFLHEAGHCLLTNYTLGGTVLQRLEALKNAFCWLIVRRMLTQFGRLWIPLVTYLKDKSPDENIRRLVKVLDKLTNLQKRLLDGWKISHEVFAFAYATSTCGFHELASRDAFGTDEREEIIRSWQLIGQFSDDRTLQQVAMHVEKFCTEHGIAWDDLDKDTLLQLAQNAEEIFGRDMEAKSVFHGWVQIIPRLHEKGEPSKDRRDSETYERLWREHAEQYASSGNEHVEALKILTSFSDPLKVEGLIFKLPVLSLFFTPRVPPAELLSGTGTAKDFGSIDDAIWAFKDFLHTRSTGGELLGDKQHIQLFLRRLIKVQHDLGWVPLTDKKVADREICGTEDWVDEVIRLATANKQDHMLLRKLVSGQITPDGLDSGLAFSELSDFLSLVPIRIVFPLGLSVAKQLRKRKPLIDFMVGVLDELEVDSARDLSKLSKRYGDGLISLTQMNTGKLSGMPSTFYKDKDSLKLVVPGDELTFFVHGIRSYFLNELCDIFVQGRRNYTLLCPLGKIMQVLETKCNHDQECKRTVCDIKQWLKYCGSGRDCVIKQAVCRLKVPGSLMCGDSDVVHHLRCFESGELLLCGEMPFELFFLGRKANEETKESRLVDDIGSQLRKIMLGGQKTQNRSEEKGNVRGKISQKVRRDTVAKFKKRVSAQGYSKFKVALGAFVINFTFISGSILFKLLSLPFRLVFCFVYLIYWLMSFPQRTFYASRRKRKIKATHEGWVVLAREIRFVLQKLAQYGENDEHQNPKTNIRNL